MTGAKAPIRTVEGTSGRLSYQEAGPASGRALVLLHGIGASSATWSQQIHALASDRRVIAWNAPGYAESAPLPAAPATAADYARALGSLLDALAIAEATIVASSWGGLVALAFVAARPEQVSRLVLSGPSTGYGHLPLAARARVFDERSERARELGLDVMLARSTARLVPSATAASVMAEVDAGRAGVHLAGYLAALHVLAQTDGQALMARTDQPTLVIAGEQDLVAPPRFHAELLASLAPRATLELLPHCGHLPHVEKATRFNDRVRSFLD
jgi:pimeloyl-ACP methyl ester carboxylesterase